MEIRDLGLIRYHDAWQIQEECHTRALEGGEESLLLLEHPPVITFGRRSEDSASHLLASAQQLAEMGVEVVQSDRGGDITFHGPGQLVAYPIIRLADRQFSVAGYVHRLEDVVIATLADFGIKAASDPAAPGVWVRNEDKETRGQGDKDRELPVVSCQLPVDRGSEPSGIEIPIGNSRSGIGDSSGPRTQDPGLTPAKICALGVRIRRGVSLHGIALNLTTDLRYFNLINPCGLSKPVTTIQRVLGGSAPTMQQLKERLGRRMLEMLKS